MRNSFLVTHGSQRVNYKAKEAPSTLNALKKYV